MTTFLKVLLLVVLALILVKFLPWMFGLGCLLAAALVGLVAFGLSALVTLLGGVLVLAALLSPIWLPLLLIFGLIVLIRRLVRRTPPAVVA
jgi:hypothetical protein